MGNQERRENLGEKKEKVGLKVEEEVRKGMIKII